MDEDHDNIDDDDESRKVVDNDQRQDEQIWATDYLLFQSTFVRLQPPLIMIVALTKIIVKEMIVVVLMVIVMIDHS